MKSPMETYEMTAIYSDLVADDPQAPYANLILAGMNKHRVAMLAGIGFKLTSSTDYKQMRAVSQMGNCDMAFNHLAEVRANFKVIARPLEKEPSSGMVMTMEPLAIGFNNTFIVLRGDDATIKSEGEAYATIAELENRGKL